MITRCDDLSGNVRYDDDCKRSHVRPVMLTRNRYPDRCPRLVRISLRMFYVKLGNNAAGPFFRTSNAGMIVRLALMARSHST